MYEEIWKEFERKVSQERLLRIVEEVFEFVKWGSYEKTDELCKYIAGELRALGLDVEDLSQPADGRTFYSGWVMPAGYKVNEARVEILQPCQKMLIDYRNSPQALFLYSRGQINGIYELEILESPQDKKDVNGKIVLLPNVSAFNAVKLIERGAVGFLCDLVPSARYVKEGDYLRTTYEWRNYSLPPWKTRRDAFGFSLSPTSGALLRELHKAQPVKLIVRVDIEPYPGRVPLISGLLKGERDQEILLVGHCDECGADDNCSQVAGMLEVARLLSERYREWKPQRSIRFLFVMEVRSLQAYVQDEKRAKKVLCGLNLDTIGTDQNATTALCRLAENFPANPGFGDEFAVELLRYLSTRYPTFRWSRVKADTIDNIHGEPMIGACVPQLFHYSGHHHTGMDVPEYVNADTLRFLTILGGTYAAFLAEAGLEEAEWLLELVRDEGIRRLCLSRHPSGRQREPSPQALKRYYHQKLLSISRLFPREHYLASVDEIKRRSFVGEGLTLEEFIKERGRRLAEANFPVPPPQPKKGVEKLVPVKLFRGFLGFEEFSESQVRILKDAGLPPGWGAPMWVQNLLFYSNGKRSLGEILALLEEDGYRVNPETASTLLKVLELRELVRLRPYLTKSDILNVIEELGIERGDHIVLHSSLSRFGYIEGGAKVIIEAFIERLGEEGTLMLPTFAYSWIGHPPYDPDESPSRVGYVTNVFWKEYADGRSLHPTHSFAARGSQAEFLLSERRRDVSPVGRSSPLGKLYDLDGKVVLLCHLTANTSMHCGEYWNGLPYLKMLCHYIEGGERKEVLIDGMPWHSRFNFAYELLFEKGLIRQTQLGEEKAYSMRVRDAVWANSEIALNSPEKLVQPECDCLYCVQLREYCKARGKNAP